MKDEKKLDLVLERFYNRYNKFNTKVLETLGEAIKRFDGLTPSEAHKLAQELKYSTNIEGLFNELSKISGKSIKDINTLLDRVAEENVDFGRTYYKVKGKKFVPYEENDRLRRYVETIKKDTYGTFKNLSKSKNIGFTIKDGDKMVFKPLKKVYRDLIDEAVFNVTTGVTDYQSAMRNTIRQLADSGVKVHEATMTSKSGYNRRIDSSVRQAVLTGIRQVNIGIQEEVGEEFGADGIEVSAHAPCAIDHLEINGRQYGAKNGENLEQLLDRINSKLDRPIGTLNCGHFVYSIVMGVSLPSYTDKELRSMRHKTLSKIEYKGRRYNKYEATQVQRRLETAIRKQKDRQIIARASGDKDETLKAQSKINKLTKEYKDFSNKAKLDIYKDRMRVSGYRRVKA